MHLLWSTKGFSRGSSSPWQCRTKENDIATGKKSKTKQSRIARLEYTDIQTGSLYTVAAAAAAVKRRKVQSFFFFFPSRIYGEKKKERWKALWSFDSLENVTTLLEKQSVLRLRVMEAQAAASTTYEHVRIILSFCFDTVSICPFLMKKIPCSLFDHSHWIW